MNSNIPAIETSISSVQKRNGRTVPFDHTKIESAIARAFRACGHEQVDSTARGLTKQVVGILETEVASGKFTAPSIEDVQNVVERVVITNGFAEVAKSYILYRKARSDVRALKKATIDAEQIVEHYMNGTDWRVKENSNSGYSFSGLMNYLGGTVIAKYVLTKLYPPAIAAAHADGILHVHDLSHGVVGYCSGWSLKSLMIKGFGHVPGKADSHPARHLDVVVSQMINFLGVSQMEFAGAQAFSSVDTLLAPFVKVDKLTHRDVKQNMQRLIFGLNVASRWGSQTPFTNLTFDLRVPEDMINEPAIVGGEAQNFTYGDCQAEMDIINLAFLELLGDGDAKGRIFTFPIPTYNLTKDFDWDSEIANQLFFVTAKYGTPYFQNYIGSNLDPKSIRAMCCRLNINETELLKRPGSMWGPGDNTGSIGVVTLNLNRLAYLGRKQFPDNLEAAKDEFKRQLLRYMHHAKDSLEIKRQIIQKNLDNGLMPYTKEYLGTFANYFSTIGICGANEACLNMIGVGLETDDGKEFIISTLNTMRDALQEIQKETGNLYNLEATPAESTSYRFARKDQEYCPDIQLAGTEERPYLTNSTHLAVGHTDDLWFALEHQNDIQHLYTGGTIFHTFLGESIQDPSMCKELVRKIAENTRLPYFSITPTFSICRDCGYKRGEQEFCPECGEPCEVYSRIVGYFRPVGNWNEGKKQEFEDRRTYDTSRRTSPSAPAPAPAPAATATAAVPKAHAADTNARSNPAVSSNVPSSHDSAASATSDLLDDCKLILLTSKTCVNCGAAREMLKDHPKTANLPFAEKDALQPDSLTERLISEERIMMTPSALILDANEMVVKTCSGLSEIAAFLQEE